MVKKSSSVFRVFPQEFARGIPPRPRSTMPPRQPLPGACTSLPPLPTQSTRGDAGGWPGDLIQPGLVPTQCQVRGDAQSPNSEPNLHAGTVPTLVPPQAAGQSDDSEGSTIAPQREGLVLAPQAWCSSSHRTVPRSWAQPPTAHHSPGPHHHCFLQHRGAEHRHRCCKHCGLQALSRVRRSAEAPGGAGPPQHPPTGTVLPCYTSFVSERC